MDTAMYAWEATENMTVILADMVAVELPPKTGGSILVPRTVTSP